jgi:hypothetical protein
LAQGEELPFEVCGESTTWVRPSEEEQNAKWRTYKCTDEQCEQNIKYPWTHYFFVVYGSASIREQLGKPLWAVDASGRRTGRVLRKGTARGGAEAGNGGGVGVAPQGQTGEAPGGFLRYRGGADRARSSIRSISEIRRESTLDTLLRHRRRAAN